MPHRNMHTHMQTHTTKPRVSVSNCLWKRELWKRLCCRGKVEAGKNRMGCLWMTHYMLCFFAWSLEHPSTELSLSGSTHSHHTPTKTCCSQQHLPISAHTGESLEPGYHTTIDLPLLPNTHRDCLISYPQVSDGVQLVGLLTFILFSRFSHISPLFLSSTELGEIN